MRRLQKHQADYRGYKIEMERRDLCWKVNLRPSRAAASVGPYCSFATITQSKREAVKMAKRRVDRLVAQETS
jgi:hypothetical protein